MLQEMNGGGRVEINVTLLPIFMFLTLLVFLVICSRSMPDEYRKTTEERRALREERRKRHRSPPANVTEFLYDELNILLVMFSVPRMVKKLQSRIDAENDSWIKALHQAAYVLFVGFGYILFYAFFGLIYIFFLIHFPD